MARTNLGKVSLTLGGNYNADAIYARLTIVMASDGRAYVSKIDNVKGVEPNATLGWETYWQLIGERGAGIRNIKLTSTSGLKKTYTITYDDNDMDTFVVTDGNGIVSITKTGSVDGVDTYKILFDNGNSSSFDVTNGKGIQSIVFTRAEGNVDVYTITYGNSQTAEFSVKNAEGIARGGTKGQVLVKKGSADFETEWKTFGDAASTNVYNGLDQNNQGYVLDARQGKLLKDDVNLLSETVKEKIDKTSITSSASDSSATRVCSASLSNRIFNLANGKTSKTSSTSILYASNWSGNSQTISAPGVSTSNLVIVSPAPNSYTAYHTSGIYMSLQGNGTATFVCIDKPSANLNVNFACFN